MTYFTYIGITVSAFEKKFYFFSWYSREKSCFESLDTLLFFLFKDFLQLRIWMLEYLDVFFDGFHFWRWRWWWLCRLLIFLFGWTSDFTLFYFRIFRFWLFWRCLELRRRRGVAHEFLVVLLKQMKR